MLNKYLGAKVFGPYKRKDGRSHVIIWHTKNIKFTVSYPKYLMEIHLDRHLNDDEEVHHKDEDITNNTLDNFEIINGSKHRSMHQSTTMKEIWVCANCYKPFEPTLEQIRNRKANLKRYPNITGPFCNRSCQGKVNN